MDAIVRWFFASAILYALLGFVVGLHMAMTHDHAQLPTHAHIMVIGWVSFAIFGLFYHQFQETASKSLAMIHFWLAQISLTGLVVGLWLTYSGETQYEPITAISSLGYVASFLVFAAAAWRVLYR